MLLSYDSAAELFMSEWSPETNSLDVGDTPDAELHLKGKFY